MRLILWFLICLFSFVTGYPYGCYVPKVYSSIWPDFCTQHLYQDPEGCSERTIKDGVVYTNFSLYGSSKYQIDAYCLDALHTDLHMIPPIGYQCEYSVCPECRTTPLLGVFISGYEYDDEGEECGQRYSMYAHCPCVNQWLPWDGCSNDETEVTDEQEQVVCGWERCHSNRVIPAEYFGFQSKHYLPHLKTHLTYCQENTDCICYWPYRSQMACTISDKVYNRLYKLLESTYLSELAKTKHNSQMFPELGPCSNHGVITRLFVHAFFYSQYRKILLDIATWAENHYDCPKGTTQVLDGLYATIQSIEPEFLSLYSQCLSQHPHPKIFYERGMIHFHRGKALNALLDISKLINAYPDRDYDELLTSDLYLQEGELYAELNLYDKAIVSLTEAITADPENKEAYFQRAGAYFETGDLDRALDNYLKSGLRPQAITDVSAFTMGLGLGIISGGGEAAVQFVPSLLSSASGLSRGLWAFVTDPVNVSQDFAKSAWDCVDFVCTHTPDDVVCKLVPELQDLRENWSSYEDSDRGRIIGHVIGKYGVDIFASCGIAKGMKMYRDLRRANRLMTYEAMAISKRNVEVLKQAAKENTLRFKEMVKLPIDMDKQGKHIVGHRNYKPDINKSIWEHPDPEVLFKKFAGKGMPDNKMIPGTAGYVEIVDFKVFVGYAVERQTGARTPTTWGRIHYAKDGVHLVPTNPRG